MKKKNQQEDFDLEEIKKKALEQFRSGKSLYDKDGAFAPMLKKFLESALEGELDSHLDEDNAKRVTAGTASPAILFIPPMVLWS